ncbi:galactokinase [Exilibacterium tricleocarpae]|uniref:Galactokinase n=1 Tax=Exilibacterium tricleocarpae TaxID=2591008 RepID=A0A545TLN8_9GAMM|nr:galactokinase [Exilibacterium tricleocarpae]TQV78155.1 galactokinase [Exilibacterium tricleocarpae]
MKVDTGNLGPAVGNAFEQHFERPPQSVFSAPGRVNLIGEHTDYNDGFVLPAAIDYRIWMAAAPREDRRINAIALNQSGAGGEPSRVSFRLDATIETDAAAPWSNYLRGVVRELLNRDYPLCGADLVIAGNVPQGAGLSSSAALETVSVSALTRLAGAAIDGVQAARVGQAAENDFVGCNCGIMDQLISCLGEAGCALLLDCRSLQTRAVPLPADMSLLVVNSNVKRGLVDSAYNVRRAQCEQVASHFQVAALRDVSLNQLARAQNQLDPVAYRRAHHVITENQRTLDAAEALSGGDLEAMGRLMEASHASMRDDFEITVPAIDALVDIIKAVVGTRGGVRMTGGGFGGCVVALVPAALQALVVEQVQQHYPQVSGLEPSIVVCRASRGAFA